jgi:uncharacterized membrane protein
MRPLIKHITKCLLAGIVALLPIGGLILTVGYLESMISSAGLTTLPFYFPGLGLLMAFVCLYLIGLTLTTFVGKWIWTRIDRLIDKLPALGRLYVSLKQILGYGEGRDAVFQESVLVPAQGGTGQELGLVTNRINMPDGSNRLVVFVPGSPNPTSGRLLIISPDDVQLAGMPVNSTLKVLVAVGKTDIQLA